MANTLLSGVLGLEFQALAKTKAKVANKENKLMEKFNLKTDAQTLKEIFEIIQLRGKPPEQKIVLGIKERYESGETLEFDDVMLLDKLYRACGTCVANKEIKDE